MPSATFCYGNAKLSMLNENTPTNDTSAAHKMEQRG